MLPAMSIQDAHTHFFSRPFFETLARLSPRPESEEQLLAEVHAKAGVEVPDGDVTVHTDRWLASMDRADVSRMVTFASLPTEAEAVAAAARHADGRLIPYTLVDPSAEGALDFATRAVDELGFRGLLFFPAMHHVAADDPRMTPFYELAARAGAPVLIHCGILRVKLRDLMGLPRPYDLAYANPLSLVPAANRHRDVTFVVPHFGAGFLRETLMAGQQCENVWLDTSSGNDWIRTTPGVLNLTQVFRAALDSMGAERILFGTDSSTFPRGYRRDVADIQRECLRSAAATDDEIRLIFGGNLERLLPRG